MCKDVSVKAVLSNASSANKHFGQNVQIQCSVPGNVFSWACWVGKGGSVIFGLNSSFVMSSSELCIGVQYCKVPRRWHRHCTDFQGSRYELPGPFSCVLSGALGLVHKQSCKV